jgi:hypothetical protein
VHALGEELLDAATGGVTGSEEIGRPHLDGAGGRLGGCRGDETGREAETGDCDGAASELGMH